MWEKIVLNLLSNAFKFTFEGGITVELRRGGRRVELTVRDTGTGIPADELPRMFERFHRVEGARGRSHEGSGIGLALVQELVKLHGGTIRVESEVGARHDVHGGDPPRHGAPARRSAHPARAPASTAARAGAYVDEALSWLPAPATRASCRPRPTPDRRQGRRRASCCSPTTTPTCANYLSALLAAHYEVEAVADGEAALADARARPPTSW